MNIDEELAVVCILINRMRKRKRRRKQKAQKDWVRRILQGRDEKGHQFI